MSASINRLYALAMKESDFASVPLLDWFVSEQIEEEATFSQIVDDLRLAQDNPQALLLLDRDLPIPCPVRRIDLVYRSRWDNVPPGDHAVRYPDGHVENITVTDGAEVRLPRRP